MSGESFITLACGALIGMLFGMTLAFAGYRLFLLLLPIWGFFFGLALGAQSIQVLLGDGFLATVTSWVVGFVVAAIFAVLAYLFYAFAVVIIAGSLGYALTVGLLTWIGLDMGPLVWLIGLVVGIALAVVTIIFNLQKWVIITATAVLGAGVVLGTFLLLFNPAASVVENPVRLALESSPLLLIVFLILAVCGVVFQVRANRSYTVQTYNNWA